jgi:hypothetical protein
MGGPKTLTIGVTVNLEHYENLRLEVSGEVDSPKDAEELSRFLDTILVRFGRSDPATADRIDSYRRRVLPGSAGIASDKNGSEEIQPPPIGEDAEPSPLVTPAAPEIPLQQMKGSLAGAGTPTVTCSSCGAPVSPAEQKMSQLFTSRTLCRICMKKL